ncbi:DUF2147 domain-containing protein [Novosphingobium album (ex Hu et al. 2023)]|uniref:DUF2147 domain-containing protein n=1 Tax=Novosphingobium album (ex Hu et al. 2023) TaxID=2930093 RepID=A0ABT0B1W9_9SPHN|nr:DUF2147 domain-containing protein [Novosphingobium album (ex Hu et al. 2023)]MCJ2179057.1 DUF2147 domain-containing protein [Novosphingobium album (ex Hu et al. 2023)]
MRFWKHAAVALLATAAFGNPAFADSPDSVLGKWQTPVRHGVVEIARCGESVCGRLLESDGIRADADLRDVNNKDAAKRTRKVKGLAMLGGFARDDGKWAGGWIYNAEDGGTYKATITPAGPNALKLKGCIVWPLCKTQNWTRLP